jgi:hypothetical protein
MLDQFRCKGWGNLAGLEARSWGFNVASLIFLGFSGVLPLFSVFLLFWCPSCILPVCLGVPLRFFNAISFITYKKKKKCQKKKEKRKKKKEKRSSYTVSV